MIACRYSFVWVRRLVRLCKHKNCSRGEYRNWETEIMARDYEARKHVNIASSERQRLGASDVQKLLLVQLDIVCS